MVGNIDYDSVKELVERYKELKAKNELKYYNEESTKKDFILPLFQALGWNVYNRSKKDNSISAEEKVSKKRVDYGFRIDGIPKFFLEAKSLRENSIHTNNKYVKQAIDYSWMKSCGWAILTNFETISIINADLRGSYVGNNIFFTLHPNDFLTDDRFELLSKSSFRNRELDMLASKWGKKQFKKPIDEQLLEDMINFRESLSKSIVKNNLKMNLSQAELDESVQRVLDRLIFIRNSEDRGLEENKLQSIVRELPGKGKGNLFKEISKVYHIYDQNYNSKLFAKHMADDLVVDDGTLLEVVEGLNHSKDNSYSYDFSIIDSDVLGGIYEQYLGNILRKSPKRAKLQQSAVHRKEQGIYYTPRKIVDYIVKNTVGEYIASRDTGFVEVIKILDPSCGSGSFLIKAYKELENYWQKQYVENKKIPKVARDVRQYRLGSEDGEKYSSFFSTKAEILKNNIFGVDLDPKAVEIAQLNLLLQISERKRRLPLLQTNIKVGNSLIDDPTISTNSFNWKNEFSSIMDEGGFDVIIGNPPYYNVQSGDPLREIDDFSIIANGVVNSAALFVKRGLTLLKHGGYMGLIIPKSFAYVDSWKKIRDLVFEGAQLNIIADVGKAFKDVLLEQVIVVIRKVVPPPNHKVEIVSGLYSSEQSSYKETLKNLQNGNSIVFTGNKVLKSIIKKVEDNSVPLGELSRNFRGLGVQKFLTEKKEGCERIVSGKDLINFSVRKYHDYYVQDDIVSTLKKLEDLRKPKIMCQNIVAHIKDHIKITCTYDEEGLLTLDTVNNIILENTEFEPEFVLGLLTSRLISHYTYVRIFSEAIRTMHFDSKYSDKIPIKKVDKQFQGTIASKVSKLLHLNKQREDMSNKNSDKFNLIGDEINALEKEVNSLVYDLYGLSSEEVALIDKLYDR